MTFTCNTEDLDQLELLQNAEKHGYLVFSIDELKQEVLRILMNKKSVGIDRYGKSPSQKMYVTLFKIWSDSNSEKDFEQFYTDAMNKMISNLNNKYNK